MRHKDYKRKFGRKKGQRRAFMLGLVSNLVRSERMMTTEARAKELRPLIEKFVTHAKKQDIASFRYLLRYLPKNRAYKLFHEIAPRYEKRAGGYTRILKLTTVRRNDGGHKSVIEFV